MSAQNHRHIKGLVIWVEMPFTLPEHHTTPDSQLIQQWQTEAAAFPDIPWDITTLPVLPLLSMDPSARIETALSDSEVWLTPQPILETGHHTVLKLAGDLQNQLALWLAWDDVLSSPDDPDKRFLLEVSTHLADRGIVFILAPAAGDNFMRLWHQFLSLIVYNARAVYAIGPGDFDWPAPIQWLADSLDSAKKQIGEIVTAQNLETTEPTVNLEMLIEPKQAMLDGYESIQPYGKDDMYGAFLPDDYDLEESGQMESVRKENVTAEAEESTLRLDTAVPEKVSLGEMFDLAVAVRQILSPILQEQDLTRTQSGDIQVSWPAGQDTIHLRIEVSAPTCEIIGEAQAKLRLRYGKDSPVFYFQLSPKRLGSLSIIVKVTQEDYWLGSARVRTRVTGEVAGVVETTVLSHKLALTHTDLEIRIGGFAQDLAGYPVEAHLSGGSHYDGGVLAIDENLLPTISHPMDYGDYLWEVLFTGPIYDAYIAASATAATATEGRLRLRLWIDADAPSLHAIIWERLLNRQQTPPQPMSISARRPFSRYIGISQSVPEPQQTPIRMLFVVSNPADLDGLASLDATSALNSLLDALEDQSRLHITVLAGDNALTSDLKARLSAAGHTIQEGAASLENIIRTLTGGDTYHILHILAHGRYVQRRSASDLYLQDNDGLTKIVSDNDITLRLSAISPLPHLVFLAACESARRHPGNQNAFVGLASKLVACGVPAVVAMQDMLPIDAAEKLTGDFYAYLILHGVVDRALSQARLLLFDPSSKIWSTPVLYMRLKDGLLFDLEV